METYEITYKLFGEYAEQPETWEVQDGAIILQAASEKDAIAKAQETIGLYVMECVISGLGG